MKKVSIGQSLSFSFSSFFGNIIFFIKGFFVTIFIAVVGVAIASLLSLPFMLPIFNKITVIKELFFNKGFSLVVFKEAWTIVSGGILMASLALFVFAVVLKLVYDYILLGWYRVSVDFYAQGKSSVSRLFSKISTLCNYFFANLFIFIILLFIFFVSFLFFLIVYTLLTKLIGVSPTAQPFYGMFRVFLLLPALIPTVYFAIRFLLYPYFIAYKNSGIFESFSQGYRISAGHVIRLIVVLIILSFIGNILRMFLFRILGFYALPVVISFFLLVKIWEIFAIGYFYGKLTSQEL